MLTYHGKQELKDKRIAMAKRHRDMDMLVTGNYFHDGTGCSVGCDAFDLGFDFDDGYTIRGIHQYVAHHWGTAEWLEDLRDTLFEKLDDKAIRSDFHIRLAQAIPVGVSLDKVYHKFVAWMLAYKSPIRSQPEAVRSAMAIAIAMHERLGNGDGVSAVEWDNVSHGVWLAYSYVKEHDADSDAYWYTLAARESMYLAVGVTDELSDAVMAVSFYRAKVSDIWPIYKEKLLELLADAK